MTTDAASTFDAHDMRKLVGADMARAAVAKVYAAAGVGENLAAGQSDIEDALQAWLASPSHCANLMQPEYRDVGLACVQRRGSRYERFWVAHFGVLAAAPPR